MDKIRVLVVFGTRPEAVKMVPVVKELSSRPGFETRVCVTAQHRQMLDQVLDIFKIQPDYDLDIMEPNQTLASLTARILSSLERIYSEFKPDWILVQGDTTTAMTAALLGYYAQVKVGHVEAGLRTFNKWQPYPEEVNRRIVGVVADKHFAPTMTNRRNLLAEGIHSEDILVTGNTVVDALQGIMQIPEPSEVTELIRSLNIKPGGKRLALVTAHRRENFGKPLENICFALKQIAEKFLGDLELIYPVHLNPNVSEPVHKILNNIPNLHLTEPMEYLPLVHLLHHSSIILTDSGGIQEEATSLKIPTLVLREVTERPEGVEAGLLKLVGTNREEIVQSACRLLENPEEYQRLRNIPNPYGDGHAAQRIVDGLEQQYKTEKPI